MTERPHRQEETRCGRRRAAGQQAAGRSEVATSEAPTEIVSPSGLLNALEPDEQRLVVLCCTLKAKEAPELLQLAEPGRAGKLVEAAQALSTLERRERLGIFARQLSPAVTREAARVALHELRSLAPWLAALACRSLPAEVREPLLYSPAVREAWESPVTPHPALESYARRLASRLIGG